jgi:hypothetical protein
MKKDMHNHESLDKSHRIDKQMSIWKEWNIINSISQQNSKGKINTRLPIITLNVNYLNSLIKRCKPAEWIKDQDQLFFCCKKLTSVAKTNTQSESERIENDIPKQMESKCKQE